MTESDNRHAAEVHGCIVCARLFNVLAVYTPEGKFFDCAVTSPGGHRVRDEQQALVACDSHSAEKIKAAHVRWQSNTASITIKEFQ